MNAAQEVEPRAKPDLVVFGIIIPLTDDTTGIVHSLEKLDRWLLETVEQFGGATLVAVAMRGMWFDPALPPGTGCVEGYSNCYKVGVAPDRVNELRAHARKAAVEFGQKCIYFERTGEAEFVWAPAFAPDRSTVDDIKPGH
jgi:hypothetical protein